MRVISFLCLANSARERGHCVAGIDLETKQWVRPVDAKFGRLTDDEVTVEGTSKPIRPFDVVLLTVGDPRPEIGQPENAPIINGYPVFWKIPDLLQPTPPIELDPFLQKGPSLFQLQGHRNDRVPHRQLVDHPLSSSLTLLVVKDPVFFLDESEKWRMKVLYESKTHELRVTDLLFRERERKNGTWVICVSLSADFHGSHYGLVAMAMQIDELPSNFTLNQTSKNSPKDLKVKAVYLALKEWRRLKVQATGRPAYTFFNNKTLEQLEIMQPTTAQELLEVFGIGPVRVEEYGAEILEVIRRSRED